MWATCFSEESVHVGGSGVGERCYVFSIHTVILLTKKTGFEREERKRRRREEKEKKVTRARIEPTAAAPSYSQPTRLDVSRSDH